MIRIILLTSVFLLLPSGCGPAPRPVQEVTPSAQTLTEASPIDVGAQDWPWWRGTAGNNVAPCETAPILWSDSQNVVWRADVPGRGHGSPAVVGSQIFLCTTDESQQQQIVLAFDRSTGQQQWKTVVHTGGLPGSGGMHPKSTHANCTVACDGHAIYVAFLNGENVISSSLTLDGKIRWQTPLGFFVPKFGYAPSPCLFESLAIYSGDNRGGGFLAAVHRETGQIVWRKARTNVDSYSSAIVHNIDDIPQLMISGNQQVASYDPQTGEQLWTCSGTAEATCGTVVAMGKLVFASGGYPQRQTVCIDATNGSKVWEDGVKCYEQSMLVARDHLFAVTDDGIAICRDAATGTLKWRQRLAGPVSASPVLSGDRIYATNEAGTTWVFEANPNEYRELAKNQLGDSAFASFAICDHKIFARVASGSGPDRQESLYCIGENKNITE